MNKRSDSLGDREMVRFGILGAGRIGKVHARTVADSGRASVAYVADAMPDAASSLAQSSSARRPIRMPT
jgi:myo-inositol 2-dehydrogenase/D-chiro-inositol 1-dehydrogenase